MRYFDIYNIINCYYQHNNNIFIAIMLSNSKIRTGSQTWVNANDYLATGSGGTV
ncbi:hypothetical protein BN1221_02941c [Brenneria goodwinii]|uniref:Uncharacterized protein n=1 Tax=Brenneria goodwinii TaxID=1109412 RepID=A0A0G4JWY7_9GAMM|nr:hypothetical protein BN1221_02941c [Brenneria goodwinii]